MSARKSKNKIATSRTAASKGTSKANKGAPTASAAARSVSPWTASQIATLKKHCINLRDGRFIESGEFSTTQQDVKAIFTKQLPDALAAARKKGEPLRVMFWAHGGLCGERETLQHVLDFHQGWLQAGIYPVYFIWETDHGTSLHDIFLGAPTAESTRGWVTDITDASLEFTLQTVGRPIWRQIKKYAENAVKKPNGGALFAAQQLAAFTKSGGADIELYAMGHSAGSIFHSWFMPCALNEGVKAFKELFLLAPAINVADFKSRLIKRIGPGYGIDHCSMFTMTEKAERDDSVIKVYRKSLLYFVSNACEEADNTPILGLQEDIYKDVELRKLYGVGESGNKAAGDICWSPNGQTSNSSSHGGFDNDIATLHSMVKRMTKRDDKPFAGMTSRALAAGGSGRKTALCVGIDQYSIKPLSGCVNDARQWQEALDGLGFETTFLADGDATYAGMVKALRLLIKGSRPGDQLVFQYAGHGTHVDDVNGDEAMATPGDTRDEALVPFDFSGGKFLIDDDIGEIMDLLPAGVSLTCFMDCCHSGSNTRAFGFGSTSTVASGETSRYLPVPAEIMIQHVKYRRGLPTKATRGAYEGKPEVLFAACSPKQEAKESGGHGYFTLTAVPLLLKSAGKLTHAQFIAKVQKEFPGHVDDQDPQLDCAKDRLGMPLLGAPRARAAAALEKTGEPAAAEQPIDVQMLNESINISLKLLDRLC